MIYEYPKEFVVPVVYADDLNIKPLYRDWELEYLQFDGKMMPGKSLQENKNFMINNYEDKAMNKEEKKLSKYDMELLQEPYLENMLSYNIVEENEKDERVKSILSEIDDEYAKSETLKI